MSKEQYIESNRIRAVEIAASMLNGSMNYLEGALDLSSLASEVGLPENDKDFNAFRGVASEVDNLPIGAPRQFWSKKALERHEPEVQEAIQWAMKHTSVNCKSIVDRFQGNNVQSEL